MDFSEQVKEFFSCDLKRHRLPIMKTADQLTTIKNQDEFVVNNCKLHFSMPLNNLDLYTANIPIIQRATFWSNYMSSLKGITASGPTT